MILGKYDDELSVVRQTVCHTWGLLLATAAFENNEDFEYITTGTSAVTFTRKGRFLASYHLDSLFDGDNKTLLSEINERMSTTGMANLKDLLRAYNVPISALEPKPRVRFTPKFH